MSKRCKITRSSDSSFSWNQWGETTVEGLNILVEVVLTDTRSSSSQRIDSKQLQHSYLNLREGVTNANRMRTDQIQLQLFEVFLCYHLIGEVSKPCVNSIDDSVSLFNHPIDHIPALLHLFPALWRQIDLRSEIRGKFDELFGC